MIHEITIDSEGIYYTFWNGHRNAVVVEYDKKYNQWDTAILKNNSPKWSNLPIYKKISFIEDLPKGLLLLHLKT